MAYEKTVWAVQDPITKERMNHIEDGIADAHSGVSTVDSKIQEQVSRMAQLQTLVANNTASIGTLQSDFSTITTNSKDGHDAWTQVAGAITMNGDIVVQSLNDRIGAIENVNSNQETELRGGRGTYDNIGDNITDIRNKINTMNSSITTIESKFASASGTYQTVEDRFAASETNITNLKTDLSTLTEEVVTARGTNGTTLNARFQRIESQLDNAKESSAKDKIFDSVDARFEELENEVVNARGGSVSIDARLDNIDDLSKDNSLVKRMANAETNIGSLNSYMVEAQGNISSLQADKVNKSDVVNNATTDFEGKALDARMGKTLQDQITILQNNASSEGDRIDALEAELNMSAEEGTRRLDEVESDIDYMQSEIEVAHASAANNVKYANLDSRFEANEEKVNIIESTLSDVETLANNLHTNVQTIANELNMISNDQIVDTNTRIDTIEQTVNALSATIGDQGDFGDRIAATESEIDQLQDDVSALDNAINGEGALRDRVTAVEIAASNAQSAADDAASAASTAQSGVDGLATRVTSLEGKDTILVTKVNINYDEETGLPTNIGQTPTEYADYLLQGTDDKYYYWRFIGGEWKLISGGGANSSGGGGNNSGYDFITEAEYTTAEKAENTDYYVKREDGYHHYRYVTIDDILTEIEIGSLIDKDNIKRYNITKSYDQTDDKYYLDLYEFGYGEPNGAENIDDELMKPIAHIELPKGGGGTDSSAITRVVRITPATVTTIKNEDKIYLRFFYSSVDTTGESHEATYTLKYNNGSTIASGTLNSGSNEQQVTTGVWPDAPRPVGFYEIDVTDYCRLGSNTFNLSVTPTGGSAIPRAWTVQILELRLESDAPDTQLVEVGESIQFPYTPYGAMTKTLHVAVDGTEIGTYPIGQSVSGVPLEYTIPSQEYGAHTISVYLEAVLDGVTIPTTPIIRDYIWYDAEDEDAPAVILASTYRGQPITIEQYGELEIPYSVYNRNASTSTVEYYVGDTLFNTVTVTNDGILTYAFEDFGEKTLTIKVGDTSLTFNVTVTKLAVDVAQVTGAVINFDPTTLTNNSANRLPTWTYNNQTYHMTVSDNFNWSDDISGGGYKEDTDGKCFVVKAGTYVEFDYKMFKQAVDNTDPSNPVFTSSVFDKGAEMKLTFKVAAVRDASAVWFTNVGNPSNTNQMPIGIQLNAHNGWLKTSAADAAEKQAAQDGTTASTNSYLYFPYSEEDKIELDISINKSGNGEDFIMSYEDGVPSKAYAYETSELLYHEPGNESVIRIGSEDCDVYIYRFRIYEKGLNTSEILRNFIADGKTIREKVNRYERNSIYYDATKPEGQQFTPYKSGSAILDPEQLAKKMPDVKILMLEAPTFTKSKQTFVKSKLRCIHAEGGTVYPSRGDEDNWLYIDGYHSGQGTTSNYYGQASRNVDFLFMCDGTHAPTKKKNITGYEGYVSKLYRGVNASTLNPTTKSWTPTVDAVEETCLDWKGSEAKVSLTSTSIPNNYFNLKVNVASSENVNNALLQKRYNDFLKYVYESPAYKRDNRIKNDMEFVPAILFIRETDTTQDDNGNYTSHLEFNDTDWHFYSLGNIGDSKKTDYTRAYDPTDMNEFTVEISDNNTNNSQFQSGVYISNGERIVEESESGINSMNYIWDLSDEEWNALRDPTEAELDHDYRVANKIKYYEDGETEVENADYKYIRDDGKVWVNYRHRMLSMEPFDGDHSFEFRYACCGDYRDGDLINATPGQDDDAQFEINRAVIEAFYEWVVTSTNDEFVDELREWVVPEAVEFFYAFTHFYTMMDNRAKNCFWHFAKTGTHRQVHHTYPALLHVYDELVDGKYIRTSDTEIDPDKTYYTEYAFDLWTYDTDTGIGIDNNGELVFPYGKEDTDYRIANVSSSGYVFNGAGSIMWRRLSQSFTDEIADVFNRVNEAACFDATNLITEFDKFQNCYPEEMWRLDIERKYIRTFTGKIYDNCKTTDDGGNTKQNTRFLKEMMQGRKKYQRRQWVRDQGIYFGSKYMLNNVRSNTIEMVCYTPDAPLWNSRGYSYNDNGTTKYRAFAEGDFTFYNSKLYKCLEANTDTTFVASKWQEGVTPDYQLKIVPYQDMYINVAVGNGNLRTPQRAVAGQEYTVDCTANMNETRVYIYAGSYIQSISGLAPFYIGANIFSSAARLKKLDLGTDNPTYHNTNLKELTILPNMPILEELNVRNCDNLNVSINLRESNNLKIVEAEGSIIPSLSLPAYTSIETLHLPSTVNILSLQSARKLTDFRMTNKETGLQDYSNLINMNITDSDYSENIDWISIALDALPHLSTLYLQNLSTAKIEDITDVEPFATKKSEIETQYDELGNLINKVNLSGLIKVTKNWSKIEKANYESIWKALTFDVTGATETTKYRLTYVYEINGVKKSYTTYVNQYATITDIFIDEIIEEPSRPATAQSVYRFGSRNARGNYIELSGWRIQGESVTLNNRANIQVQDNTTVEAVFNTTPRTYNVRWLLEEGDTTPIKIETDVSYAGGETLEAPSVADIRATGRQTASFLFDRNQNPPTVNYRIFNGWNKLPINIQPDASDTSYDIYGTWIEGTTSLPALFSDTTTFTPEQLYVFAHMSDSERNQYGTVGQQVSLQMGYTGPDDGIQLVGDGATQVMSIYNNRGQTTGRTQSFATPMLLDGSTPRLGTQIQPLKLGADAFTIAIDYSFDKSFTESSSLTETILMGCYDDSGSAVAGFKLFNRAGEGPAISFGDTQTTDYSSHMVLVGDPDTISYRNTIVLRHEANSKELYIYSGMHGGSDGLSSGIIPDIDNSAIIQVLSWENVNTDAYLVFGHHSLTSTSSVLGSGQGIIYWAKYWDRDLGIGECRKLATWNHETMTFGFEEFSGMDNQYSRFVFIESNTPNLVLTSLNSSTYGRYTPAQLTKTAGEVAKWEDSTLQSIANKRIFPALPTAIQSIITLSPIRSRQAICTGTGIAGSNYVVGNSESITTNDYVFFPSAVEMGNSNETTFKGHEARNSMLWYTSANTEVYNYNNTALRWDSTNGNADYMNLRFPYIPIHTTEINRVYSIGTYSGTRTYYSLIGATNIKRGDILIDTNNKAYIYVTSDDIDMGAPLVTTYGDTDPLICEIGGWVEAWPHWTRSPVDNNGGRIPFQFVKDASDPGALQTTALTRLDSSAGFNYSFSI